MAASPNNAQILFTSATWGTAIGVVVGYQYKYMKTQAEIRADGSVNPDAIATFKKNSSVIVTFIDMTFFPADSDTAASLVLVMSNAAGSAQTMTFASMLPREYSGSFNREAPPNSSTIEFVSKAPANPTMS